MLPPWRRPLHEPEPLPPAPPTALREENRSMGIAIGFESRDPHYLADRTLEALVARATHQEPPASARHFVEHSTFAHLAHAALMQRGLDRGLDPYEKPGPVIQLALGNSDFPLLLGDALGKVAEAAYEHTSPAYRQIAAPRTLKNFRPHRFMRRVDFPLPLLVGETVEIAQGTLGEAGGETATAATYARIVDLSYHALVNDDLEVFKDLALSAANRVVDLEDALLFEMFTSGTASNGPTLVDGSQLFAAGRGNLAASGAVISATTISAARAAVMGQTSPEGVKSIAVPRLLVCPPALVTLAESELAKLALGTDPAWRMRVVPAANLSGTAWYVSTDPRAHAALIYGHVGQKRLSFMGQKSFRTGGAEFKLLTDYSVAAIGWRGLYRNPGA